MPPEPPLERCRRRRVPCVDAAAAVAGKPVVGQVGGHSRTDRGQVVARRGHRSAAAHMLGFSRPLSYIQGKRRRWGLAPPNWDPIRSALPVNPRSVALHGCLPFICAGFIAGPRRLSESPRRRRAVPPNSCTEGRGRCGSVHGVPVAPPEVGTGRARLLPPLIGPFHFKLANAISLQRFSYRS